MPQALTRFELDELSISELHQRLESGADTSRGLVRKYLRRIRDLNARGPCLRAVIEVNPDAMEIAAALDAERRTQGPRGPLHGVPVLLKDNIDTADQMTTTAGSLALAGSIAPQDSFVADRLRAAGVVLLGKTNLSEWANFRGEHSISGWSARGGQTRNPYVLGRNPSGSSSGSAVAVAANLGAAAVGTETNGSITCPSAACSIVGLKPTLGLISRAGVIPVSHSQDTAGPMTRTVSDAAILLSTLAGPDPRDPATAASASHLQADYTRFLDPNGLSGARLGVARLLFDEQGRLSAAMHERFLRLFEDCLEVMRAAGAVVIDPVEIRDPGSLEHTQTEVLLVDFKADLNQYLKSLGPEAPVKSLREVIAFNEQHAGEELCFFGQEIMERAEAKGSPRSKTYRKALETNHRLSREEGIDLAMDRGQLDAIICPTMGPSCLIEPLTGDYSMGGYSPTLAAVAGYPHLTVPAGYLLALPVGLSFFGRAWSEPILLKLAYAFEQLTKHRRPPRFLPSLDASLPGVPSEPLRHAPQTRG